MSILVLALFLLLCGLHIAGMHHDSQAEGFTPAAFVLLVAAGLLFLVVSTRPGAELSLVSPPEGSAPPPPARTSSHLSPLGAPLLC